MKLSVCMIVKNEEKMLPDALDSVREADEIVVCDTGSTDSTVEIAKLYTDKVYTDFVWCDDFAKARNHAMKKCTGDWILVIDADERLVEGGMWLIRNSIKVADLAVSCNIIAKDGRNSFKNVRVHKNDPRVFWSGAAHNYLSVTADTHCEATVVYGYSPAHSSDPDRTMRILQKAVTEDPNLNREWYYLAREYYYRQRWVDAIGILDVYIRRSKHPAERADAYLMKARCLWNLRRGDEARENCALAIIINANFKEAVLFMAQMSWEKNAKTWRKFAEACTNEDVLFIRG